MKKQAQTTRLPRTSRSTATLSVFLLAAAVSASVHAQQAASSAQAEADAQDQAQDASPDQVASKKRNQDAVNLDRVIVTGNRTAKDVDKIPGAITVVSQAEVAHTLLVTEDATAVLARTVPGYAESSQAMSNTGETLRGRIALRLFDGVPQTSPLREGGRSATFTDMGLVGRIEVINGPSASEGVGASGGIINYISKVPTKFGSEFTLTTRYTTQFDDDSSGYKVGGTYAYKADAYDLVAAASYIDRGMTFDGNSRRIGLNTSGSVADSEAKNYFIKGGWNFGEDGEQRLQASYSNFKITGKGNYFLVDGDRDSGETNTSERGQPLGALTEFNDFEQATLAYSHSDFFGGTFTLDAYKATQAMRYPSENGADRQDPLLAPIGTLVDQSEIDSDKKGIRTSWTRPALFGIEGFELRTGFDYVKDTTEQRLARFDRLWVPPMEYTSKAPYAQLSYDLGPLTFSGGYRREDGELTVEDYTTTYFRNRVFVEGGTLAYKADLTNLGAVWKINDQFSAFVATGKGFSLPNVGIPLRNINIPGQSVKGILDLQAIIVKNNEVGLNWRGAKASLGGSVYKSDSDLGVSLSVDPISNDFVMNRAPVTIKGVELSGSWDFNDNWKSTFVASHIEGKTTFFNGGPKDKEMGVLDINPDKIAASLTWQFSPHGDITLGSTTLLSRDLNEGTGSEEHTSGYTLYDLGANYDFEKYGKLSMGVENLTDKFYILSWSQVVGFRNYWAGRGRVISITHTIKF